MCYGVLALVLYTPWSLIKSLAIFECRRGPAKCLFLGKDPSHYFYPVDLPLYHLMTKLGQGIDGILTR